MRRCRPDARSAVCSPLTPSMWIASLAQLRLARVLRSVEHDIHRFIRLELAEHEQRALLHLDGTLACEHLLEQRQRALGRRIHQPLHRDVGELFVGQSGSRLRGRPRLREQRVGIAAPAALGKLAAQALDRALRLGGAFRLHQRVRFPVQRSVDALRLVLAQQLFQSCEPLQRSRPVGLLERSLALPVERVRRLVAGRCCRLGWPRARARPASASAIARPSRVERVIVICVSLRR